MTTTTSARTKAQQAHKRTVEHSIAQIAEFLQQELGQKLTAYIAKLADAKAIGRYAKGTQKPSAATEERLRAAFQVFHMLQSEESSHTVRAWFIGLNPQLDDVAPAEVIREGRIRDVLIAAKVYNAGG